MYNDLQRHTEVSINRPMQSAQLILHKFYLSSSVTGTGTLLLI